MKTKMTDRPLYPVPGLPKSIEKFLEWEELQPKREEPKQEPEVEKPPPISKEELEEIQRRRIRTKAELESVSIWSAQDIATYLNKERHWISEHVIDKLKFHVILGKTSYYWKDDVVKRIQALRIPTDRRKAEHSLSSNSGNIKKKRKKKKKKK